MSHRSARSTAQNLSFWSSRHELHGAITYHDGTTLESSLGDLKRKLVTLWIINRQRDSIELLKSYSEAITRTSRPIFVTILGRYT